MMRPLAQTILLMVFLTCLLTTSHGQGGKREASPTTERTGSGSSNVPRPRKRKNLEAKKPVSKVPLLASLTVIVNPADTGLYLNGQQVEGPTIPGLEPRSYLLTFRRDGYQEEVRSINLVAGDNTLSVNLALLTGTLNLTPNIADAEITVQGVSGEEGKSVQLHNGLIKDLRLTPGDYHIVISKQGYLSLFRKISIQAGAMLYLEPRLEPIPIDPPRRLPADDANGNVLTANETKNSYQPAIPSKKVSPTYPAAARTGRVKGTVTVVVEIDERGTVRSAKASDGPGLLRRSAENAAKQWRFIPAQQNGVAVPSTQEVRFSFEL